MMAMGARQEGNEEQLMGEINTTPLVDVMLVLLIIFMVTAPMFTHAVKVDLPKAQSTPNQEKPDRVAIVIEASGRTYWNAEVVGDGDLQRRLEQASKSDPQPEIHLRADKNARYEWVAKVMAFAQRAGLRKMGFLTDPADTGGN
jgi:biopolymer transport protein ExbD